MLSARILLVIASTSHVWTAILEDVGQVDLEAVRIRLEEEKAKRLLLQNDVEVLMLQLEELKRKYDQKEDKASGTTFPGSGMTYVRWGRTVCPGNGTELIYKGYMAGTEHRQSGNGPNNLCLPEDPTWAKYQDGTSDTDHRAHVYGTEYEMGHKSFFSPFSPDLLNNDVPCAACRSTRSSSIMIPGRTNCYLGWTVEYSGYLVSMYYNHAGSTEYVCLDGDPESLDGGKTDLNGHMIYLADVICGALRCPPYVNGRELACVVCSK
ncbi:hypothetical protein CHS0354_037145 [Potamilus streckersoni]|uniref:Short-chain collagen C4-like n=1 Tax=Potamilus streckersoni TaxID=2493646 RepID=A0AAE0VHJ3_9BIVA|nr:hypothetical protein CHS0354_037145 [Potamilus streckersoni]